MTYSIHWPHHIQFGTQSLEQLPQFLETLPKPIVAVVDNGVRSFVEPFLKVRGKSCLLITNTTINPSWDAVSDLRHRIAGIRPKTIIGVGGGSTLDVVKAVSHVPPELNWTDIRGVNRIPEWPERMTSVLIPTTAGTGSEISPSIVLADPELNKAAATSPNLVADVAWIDPLMILTAPLNVTRDSGIDALTHSIEAYLALGHNPLTDAIALKGIELIVGFLPRLVSGDRNEAVAEAVSQGSLLGGFAFSVAGLGAIHGLSYTLSHRYGLSHGRSNALLLGPVLSFNQSAAPNRVSTILAQFPEGATTVSRIREWLHTLGVPPTLHNYGGSITDCDSLSDEGFRTGQRLFGNNVRPITPQDVQNIMEGLFET